MIVRLADNVRQRPVPRLGKFHAGRLQLTHQVRLVATELRCQVLAHLGFEETPEAQVIASEAAVRILGCCEPLMRTMVDDRRRCLGGSYAHGELNTVTYRIFFAFFLDFPLIESICSMRR